LWDLKVTYLDFPTGAPTGCIIICQRLSADKVLYKEAIKALETQVMDQYFHESKPLFSSEHFDFIRERFGGRTLELSYAHSIIFPESLGLGYSLDMFLGDICRFSLSTEGAINFDEVVLFIKEME